MGEICLIQWLILLSKNEEVAHILVKCGDGSFAQLLADQWGGAVTGIDRDHTMIEQARVQTGNQSIRFIEDDFMRYSFEEQFDFISATASLHHMPFEQALEKMVLRDSWLKPQVEAMPLSVEIHVSCTQRGKAACG